MPVVRWNVSAIVEQLVGATDWQKYHIDSAGHAAKAVYLPNTATDWSFGAGCWSNPEIEFE